MATKFSFAALIAATAIVVGLVTPAPGFSRLPLALVQILQGAPVAASSHEVPYEIEVLPGHHATGDPPWTCLCRPVGTATRTDCLAG